MMIGLDAKLLADGLGKNTLSSGCDGLMIAWDPNLEAKLSTLCDAIYISALATQT